METTMKKTKYPGVHRLDDGRFHIRVTGRCPKTGKKMNRKQTIDIHSLSEAVRIREEMRAAIARGGEEGDTDRARVADAAISWLRGKRNALKPSTIDRYARALDHALADLGDIYLDRLSRADIIAWRDGQLAGYAASTVNSRLRVLKTMLADATAERGLRNPAHRIAALPVRLTYGDPDGANVLESEELRRLLANAKCEGRWYPVFLFLAFTGVRFGEMAALRRGDLDLAKGRVHIRRAKWKQTVGTTKTGRTRTIPLAAPLVSVLEELIDVDGDPNAIVFPSSKGTMLSNGSARGALLRALDRAEIWKPFTLHGFRRTFNNLVRRETKSTMVVKALTGHSTDRMTEHYSHVGDGEKRAAMAPLAAVIPFPIADRSEVEVSSEVSRAPSETTAAG